MQQLCTVHQEVIIQKNDNEKDQCLQCMEIQYNNEIINVEETIREQQKIMSNNKLNKKDMKAMKQQKIKLTQELNEEHIKYSNLKLRKFNYRLLKQYPKNYYYSFVFNEDSTLLFASRLKDIKLFKFKNGIKLLQTLNNHTIYDPIGIYMNKCNLLAFGSFDKSIFIWNKGNNSDWQPYQKLEGHYQGISVMINNEDEDLLISGSLDKTIIFWRKTNMKWSCEKTIKTGFYVQSLSLNKQQTKLISCGLGSNKEYILIMEFQSAQWSIKQMIQVNCCGMQLCFISNSKFLFQGKQECLEIYGWQQDERIFKKEATIQVQKGESFYNDGHQCKYIESKGFVIIKYGKYLNFFGIDENQNCELSHSIDFKEDWVFENISSDGQYLITRDKKYDCVVKARKFVQLE